MALGEIQQIVAIIADADVAAILSRADRIESRKHPRHLLDEDLVRRRNYQDTIVGEMVAQGREQTPVIDQVLDDLRSEDQIEVSEPPDMSPDRRQ